MNEEQQLTRSIFDQESSDRVKSPEKLNEYIRIATPGAWLIVLALCIMFAGFIIWGFMGAIPVYYHTTGVGMAIGFDPATADLSNEADFEVKGLICFADAADVNSHNIQDKEVSVVFNDGKRMRGRSMLLDTTPEKDTEVMELLKHFNVNSEWVLSRLGAGTFRYPIYVQLDGRLDYLYWGEVANVEIIEKEVRPIDFLLGEVS